MPEQSPRLLLLVDLSSIWHAAWHATADQELSRAHQNTVARVHEVIEDGDATHVAICLDAPPYTIRKAILPTYKAQRDTPPPGMLEQFQRVKDRLVADGLLLWSAPGYEADDIIATAAVRAIGEGFAVTIVSSDKDLLQLVSDTEPPIRCFSLASRSYYDGAAVAKKFGVEPKKMLDFLSLTGDKSDNVPGVRGVGPVIAAKLLQKYGSMDEALAHADKQTPSLMQALIEDAENARKARQVIRLRDDAPIRWEDLFEERPVMPLHEVEPLPDESNEQDESPEPAPELPPPVKATAIEKPATPPTTTLAVRSDDWSMALEPRTMKEAYWLAEQMANSRLFSRLGGPQACYMVLLRGRALGLDAMAAASAFHRIDDKITMHADLIAALVLRSGKAKFLEMVESDRTHATYETQRHGGRRVIAMTFTIEDAFHARLVEKHASGLDGYRGISQTGKPSNWDKYRATMLRHRCQTQLVRAVYPDVVLGLYTPDEMGHEDVIDTTIEAA